MGGGKSFADQQYEEQQKALAEGRAAANIQLQEESRTRLLDRARADRAKDIAEGRTRGAEIFGEGALGRVGEKRSQDVADLIARRKKEAEGFTPEEQNAFREQNLSTSNQSLAGQQRALKVAQAQSGVRGPLAAAQSARLMSEAQGQNAAGERELFLKNIDAKRSGLNSYEGSLSAAEKNELDRIMYNIQQKNAEKFGQLSTELGYASLGAGERAGINQVVSGEAQAQATREAANKGGGGICCFIFLEARYGDGTMDDVVRRFRDENMTDQNRRGYYKVAEVLVPLMRRSKIVKTLVRLTMTDPCVAYGKYHYNQKGIGWIFRPVVTFWLGMFHYIGGEHPFLRENGEVI